MKIFSRILILMALVSGLSFAGNGFGARVAFEYGMTWGAENLEGGIDSPSGIGLEGGLMFRYEMLPYLQLVPGVFFEYLNTQSEDDYFQVEVNQANVEIPVVVRGIVGGHFYAEFGAQLNLNVWGKVELTDVVTSWDGEKEDITIPLKEDQSLINVGVVFGLGAQIVKGLSLDVRFFLGLMELYDWPTDEMYDFSGLKMMSIKAGINYWFI